MVKRKKMKKSIQKSTPKMNPVSLTHDSAGGVSINIEPIMLTSPTNKYSANYCEVRNCLHEIQIRFGQTTHEGNQLLSMLIVSILHSDAKKYLVDGAQDLVETLSTISENNKIDLSKRIIGIDFRGDAEFHRANTVFAGCLSLETEFAFFRSSPTGYEKAKRKVGPNEGIVVPVISVNMASPLALCLLNELRALLIKRTD